MAVSNLQRSRIRNFITLLLFVVVVFGAYFFFYTDQREDQITRHHLRLLSSTGRYSSDALEGLLENVRIAMSTQRRGGGDRLTTVEGKLEQITAIEKEPSTELHAEDLLKTDNTGDFRFETYRPDRGVFAEARVGIALDMSAGDPQLAFVMTGDAARLPVYGANLRELLAPTLPSELFDGVLVARENGDVLFQEGRADITIEKLDLSSVATGDGADAENTRAAMSETQVLDMKIAGATQKVFVQPIKLPVHVNVRDGDSWRQEQYWVAVGYMTTGRFRGMAMAISPTVVLTTIGLIVVGLLCLPFLKIRYMGPREELRHADVVALIVTTVVAAALVTFGVLYYVGQFEQSALIEDDLRDLSTKIQTQLGDEIERADEALVALNARSARTRRDEAGTMVKNILTGEFADALTSYPFLEMAFWMDFDGWQTAKWTVKDNTTSVGKFSTRRYFQAALLEQMWPGPPAVDTTFMAGRFVESIRSKTTGDEYAVLTRRLNTRNPSADNAHPNAVAAIEARLLSVISPALPPGFGFAVVDGNGEVKFHSDRIRNVRENFYDELESSRATRSAVESGQCAIVNVSYRTIPTKILVAPVENTPWSLIVFTGVRDMRVWLTETLTLAIAVYGAYLILLLVVGAFLRSTWPGRVRPGEPHSVWFWPNDGHRSRYGVLALTNVVLLAAGGVIVYGGHRVGTVVTCGALPLVSLFALHVSLKTDPFANAPSASASSGWRSSAGWYGLMAITMVGVTGLLPAVGFYKVVFNEQEVLRTKATQVAFVETLKERRGDLRAWYAKVNINNAPPELRRAIERVVRVEPGSPDAMGVYAPRGWSWNYDDADSTCGGDDSHQRVVEWISHGMHRLGFATGVSLRTAGTGASSRGGEGEDRYRWQENDTTLCMSSGPILPLGVVGKLAGREPPPFRADSVVVRSRLRGLGIARHLEFWFVGVIGLLLLVWMVRRALEQLFLVDFNNPRAVDGTVVLYEVKAPLAGLNDMKHAVLLRFRVRDEERASYFVIENDDVRRAESMELLVAQARDAERTGILLAEFDHGLKEPAMVERKLELLERLSPMPDKRVIIESAVDPMYFLTERFKDHWKERDTLGISLERWAAVLQPFARLRTPPDTSAAEFREWLEHLHADPATCLAPDVFDALVNEGLRDKRLQEFAKRLAVHPDIRNFRAEDVIDNVLDLSQAHYRKIWSSCSTDEKMLLYRIGQEGFVSRAAVDTLRPLIRRGLVCMDPNCRIMNESFRRFALSAERPEVYEKWQTAAGPSVWSRMRTPIIVSVVVLTSFFFVTQRQTFNQALGILAALTASAPALIRLLGAASSPRQSDVSKSSG